MTLVGRHFVLSGFLCREDAEDEIAIEDGFGAGWRRGMEGGGEKSEIKFVEERRDEKRGLTGKTRTLSRHSQPNTEPEPGTDFFCRLHHSASSQPFLQKRKTKTCIIFINRQTQQAVATHPTRRPNVSNHLFPVQGTNTGVTAMTEMVHSPRVSTTRASASLPAISSSRTR